MRKTPSLLRFFPRSWRPYILHMRPRAFPVVAAHFSVGVMLASEFQFTPDRIGRWIAGVLLWAGFGHSGTLALNSAIDRDQGDIGYLSNPPPVPRFLWLYALVLLVLGGAGAAFLSSRFWIIYAICMAMAILYSVPPVRLRKHFLVPSLIIGIGVALGFLIGATLSRGTSLTGTIVFGALLLVAFNTGPSMTKDLADVDGHQASGIISLPVVVGIEKAAKITSVVALSSWIFAFLFLMLFDMKPVVFLTVGACFVFSALAIRNMLSDVNDQDNVILSFRLFALGGLATYASMVVGAFLG